MFSHKFELSINIIDKERITYGTICTPCIINILPKLIILVFIFFNKIMNNVLMGIKELSGSIGPWAMLEDVEMLEDDQTIG